MLSKTIKLLKVVSIVWILIQVSSVESETQVDPYGGQITGEYLRNILIQLRAQNVFVDLYFGEYIQEIDSCIDKENGDFFNNLYTCQARVKNAKIAKLQTQSVNVEPTIASEAESNLKSKIQNHYENWVQKATSVYENHMRELETSGIWVAWNDRMSGVPKYAVKGGEDKWGRTIYVARALHSGSQIGRYVLNNNVMSYSYGDKGYTSSSFEILTHKGAFFENDNGSKNIFIPGGNGQYICQVRYDGEVIPGKLDDGRCYFEFARNEKSKSDWWTLKRSP